MLAEWQHRSNAQLDILINLLVNDWHILTILINVKIFNL